MLHKTLSGGGSIVGDRIARFVISDDSIDRTNEQVVQDGGDYSLFMQNPIVLANHDPAHPIGTAANIRREGTKTIADLKLAPPGVSQKADEVWGLIQCGVLKSVSIGFDPVLSEPMDPARPRGPQRFKKWVLCEISVVSIPAQSRATLIDATSAKSMSESAKAERRRKAAAFEKTGRQQAARAAARGNTPAATAPQTPLASREERMGRASEIKFAGLSAPDRVRALMPSGPQKEAAFAAEHARKVAATQFAHDYDTGASKEMRQAKARETARRSRSSGG